MEEGLTEGGDPIEIPWTSLSAEALQAVIESFILREGTDYGWEEASYTTKSSQILKQLKTGDIRLFYDPNTDSVTLLPKTS